jgi:DNA-binding CsgD family transcriptional regulator
MADVREATWRFINAAPVAAAQSQLDDLFADTLQSFAVDRFDCGQMPMDSESGPPRFLSDRGLSAWKQYYFDQAYNESDPCGWAHRRFSGAYTWSDVKALVRDRPLSPMWNEARANGMAEGLIVRVAPRRPVETVVRMTTPRDGLDPTYIPLLRSISVIYATSTASFSDSASAPREAVWPSQALSERELECLHWSARGKTNAEIGVIVRISRHTVNTHVESAKRKLGVATRVQAVALAHQLGLLSIA